MHKPNCFIRSVKRSGLAAAIALAFSMNASANLIGDGDFEGDGSHTPNNGSYTAGSTYIPSWTVYTSGTDAAYRNVQWIQNGSYTSINAHDGIGLIDLTGNPDYGVAGLQQAFATTVGTAYSVTLFLGYAQTNQGFGGPVSATVSIGGANPILFAAGPGTGDQTSTVWTSFEYDFVATSASSLLRIEGASSAGVFLGLDSVDAEVSAIQPVTPPPRDPGAVPEPESIALMGIGLLAFAAEQRRRRRI